MSVISFDLDQETIKMFDKVKKTLRMDDAKTFKFLLENSLEDIDDIIVCAERENEETKPFSKVKEEILASRNK